MKRRGYARIDAALEIAPAFVVPVGSTPALLTHPDYPGGTLSKDFNSSVPIPGSIIVATPKELEDLLRCAHDRLNTGKRASAVKSEATHESRHAHAARLMGASALQVGVRFGHIYEDDNSGKLRYRGKAVQPFVAAFYDSDPELKCALQVAYPEVLSAGDIQILNTLNHTVDGLASIVRAYNETHGGALPVPLSASE